MPSGVPKRTLKQYVRGYHMIEIFLIRVLRKPKFEKYLTATYSSGHESK